MCDLTFKLRDAAHTLRDHEQINHAALADMIEQAARALEATSSDRPKVPAPVLYEVRAALEDIAQKVRAQNLLGAASQIKDTIQRIDRERHQ